MTFQDIEPDKAVAKLIERIKAKQMNLLVGSGVSCCACGYYKNWINLLRDMVAYLYPEELEKKGIDVKCDDRYFCHYFLTNKKDNLIEAYVYDTIKSIVEREGVLAIPSQYVKRTGIRESIEAYIESHTPQIDYVSNTISLFDNTLSINKEQDLTFLNKMLNVGWNAIFTTNYDNLLHFASVDEGRRHFDECYDAASLSLRKMNEVIIKLHGSIDFEHKLNGFDGDVHRKYVLTQEDYNDYPSQHEAFMQLMRISLLKDCFCLIGFSGKDPNFISWISWVRDILEAKKTRAEEQLTEDDIKIFFIDCFDKPLNKATEHFFENHKIYRIVLPSPEVLSLISATDFPPEDTDEYRRYVFSKFFDNITKDKDSINDLVMPNKSEVGESASRTMQELEHKGESVNLSSYSESTIHSQNETNRPEEIESNTLWAKAYSLSGSLHRDITINVQEAKELLSLRSQIRIVRSTHYQSLFLDAIKHKEKLTELEVHLSLLALEQLLYYTDYEEVIIKKVKPYLRDADCKDRIMRLENRIVTLSAPHKEIRSKSDSDRVMYEKCLRFAFSFDFSKLKDTLYNWYPEPDYLINKAVFLSFVDYDACSRMLTTNLLDSIPTRVERYRATQLANILYGDFLEHFSTKDYLGLTSNSLFSLRDWFFGKSLQPKERIRSYGNCEDVATFDVHEAIRSLQFLIELPSFVQLRRWSIVDNTQWYKVAHGLFEMYPYPVMFYSTTMNDTNTLCRIGQDYAYSYSIHKQLPGLVERMFSLLVDKSIPKSYWQFRNVCVLLAEMIKAVPPRYWNNYVLQLWRDYNDELFEKGEPSDELFKLICVALSRTGDSVLIATIIRDALAKVRKNNKYSLAQNLFYYSRTKHSKTISREIEQDLSMFIDGLCDIREYILLGNLNRVINRDNINKIAKTIPHIIQQTGNNSISSVNGLVYFAQYDDAVLTLVRKIIIENPSLWDNGIREGGFSQCEFLPIVDIDEQLKWTKNEVIQVYDKLKDSALQIINVDDSIMSPFMNREDLYNEMLQFMDIHREDLEGSDFVDLYSKIEIKYKELTSFIDVDRSIYSNNEETVKVALETLAKRIKREGIENHLGTINILITRILCNNRIAFQSILDYLQYFIRFFAKDKDTILKVPQLIQLLDSLSFDTFKEMEQNVLVCSELTIIIAQHLNKYGIASEGVNYWMDFKKSRFFNWSICDTTE